MSSSYSTVLMEYCYIVKTQAVIICVKHVLMLISGNLKIIFKKSAVYRHCTENQQIIGNMRDPIVNLHNT